MTNEQKIFVHCREMKKGSSESITDFAMNAKVPVSMVIPTIKKIIDNGFDQVEDFAMLFSSDYTQVQKGESFAIILRTAYFDYMDNVNYKLNYGKRNSRKG